MSDRSLGEKLFMGVCAAFCIFVFWLAVAVITYSIRHPCVRHVQEPCTKTECLQASTDGCHAWSTRETTCDRCVEYAP